MKTEAQQIAERIENVLASKQWAAIKKSFASRMDVIPSTSFTINEKLDRGELSLVLNYELGEEGVYLSTYSGKYRPNAKGLNDTVNDNAMTEVFFNAEGKYVFNFQEAINLLEGRAVFKSYYTIDAVERNGWFKVERRETGRPLQPFFSGGQSILPNYDLVGTLKKLPMSALAVEQRSDLIHSLQSGDLQEVRLQNNGKELTCYIQAAPESKGLSVFDCQMQTMKIQELSVDTEKIKLHKKRNTGLSMGRSL